MAASTDNKKKAALLIINELMKTDEYTHKLNNKQRNQFRSILAVENVCSSSSSAIILQTELYKHVKTIINKPRIEKYVEKTVDRYTNEEFRQRFRCEKATFSVLEAYMEPFISSLYVKRVEISAEKQLLIYLYYASCQLPLIRIGDVFGVCEATVFKVVGQLSKIIVDHVMPKVIKWPTGERLNEIMEGFKTFQGFPSVIGALDGTHVPIKAPKEFPENYFNRKKFYSVNVMAICDHEYFFTSVYSGWPGSAHDARVLQNSPLYTDSEDVTVRRKLFPDNSHLVADSAYALEQHVLVPYKDFGNLTDIQKNFNFKHSSTRIRIEHAFGILKGRFRRLKYVDMHNHNRLIHFITSCFAVHNICLQHETSLDDYLNEGLVEEAGDNENFGNDMHGPNGEQKRTAISLLLSM